MSDRSRSDRSRVDRSRLASTAPHALRGSSGPDLAALLAHLAPHDGCFELRLPGVHAIRRSRVTEDVTRSIHRPAFCLVAQGSKVAMLGREVFAYDSSRFLVISIDLPLAGQVVRASESEPFLALRLDLDPYKLAELVLKVFPQGAPPTSKRRGLYVGAATEGLVDAATRLLTLMAHPRDAELLGPLVVDEILIRLLQTPVGTRVAQIGHTDSRIQRIARAVSWMRSNFAHPTTVDALAGLVNMSVSSFHQHFKAVTAMSPLQYQKVLRLQEARRLMLSRSMDASVASRQVGYLSPSQFSREYARFFGAAPTKDVARLREHAPASLSASR